MRRFELSFLWANRRRRCQSCRASLRRCTCFPFVGHAFAGLDAASPASSASSAALRSRWRRAALSALLLPFVFAGGTAGAYYLRLHRIAGEVSLKDLPAFTPEPPQQQQPLAERKRERRILVLAPHCDDETLGLGAMIADARRQGLPVTVAFLTNGDGFPAAARRSLGEVSVSRWDYIRFAEKRQKEALSALRTLGVGEADAFFLGYPDRGLNALWTTNWDRNSLFRSGYTRHSDSPYERAFTRHAPYCGEALLSDLVRLMRATRPTEIYVTHPADDHPDHSAAAAFAQAALRQWRLEEARNGGFSAVTPVAAATAAAAATAETARLRYYIVHRGDWPLPQGRHPNRPLLPPPGLMGLDTRWSVTYPTRDAREAKSRALSRYVSQMNVAGRFLSSFVRMNELVGDLPEMSAGASAAGSPAAPDAIRDNVMRYTNPSSDLSGLSVWRDGNLLRVRVQTSGPVSSRVGYSVRLRAIDRDSSRFVEVALPVTGTDKGRSILEAALPLSSLGIAAKEDAAAVAADTSTSVWVSAQTRWPAMPLFADRTGYRLFHLKESSKDTRLARR